MSLDPLTTTQRITDNYRNYLRSSFSPRQRDLAHEFELALGHAFRLTRGPYLQVDPPFVTGSSVGDLVAEGVLSQGFENLGDGFPLERPLYRHQEEAIRKSVGEDRNLIVSTGTGSGKTECFLFPIIDHLLRERDAGTLDRPGVRALLLYPMNALANDQVKRLRRLLADLPDITFGRYVGETAEGQVEAEDSFRARYPSEERLSNELISREVMREQPPHILLTNYAMLEYLLLRPQDSTLFDGPTGDHWRFLALDEAHIYNGAQGTEVAMLLRRLRDRVIESEPGRLRCFATSATLGKGQQDYPELVEFAESLFAEPFEWDDDDPTRQDIVVATRKDLVRDKAAHEIPQELFAGLQRAFRAGASADELAAMVGTAGSVEAPTDDQEPPAYLYHLLSRDKSVVALQSELERGSVELGDIATRVFTGPTARQDVVALIDLCVAAKSGVDDAPLIPARYHFFLRSLEGAFVCLHPGHTDGEPSLLLQRFGWCPSCSRQGREAAMFELGVCRNCGAGYLVGNHEGGEGDAHKLKTAGDWLATREYYVLGSAYDPEQADDDDEAATGVAAAKGVTELLLCPSCGTVSPDGKACQCPNRPTPVSVGHVDLPDDDPTLHSCVVCASRTSGEAVTRFVTGTDAPVAVIATDLYQQLPESRDPAQAGRVGGGRKLLTFSDSRQDAAFFAPYLERTYQRAIQRRLIAGAITKLAGDEAPRFEDLVDEVRRRAGTCLVLDPDDSRLTNTREVSAWLTLELRAIDRRQSLEGTGTAEIALALPRDYEPPRALFDLGFSHSEATDLFQMLLETVRSGGAITLPEGVEATDVRFEPKNREYGIRGLGSTDRAGVLAWSPAPTSLNRRLDILNKVFAAKQVSADPRSVLDGFWRHLTDPNTGWDRVFEGYQERQHGALWRLRHERFEFLPVSDTHRPYRCGECNRVWWRTVGGICATWRCAGKVFQIEDLDMLKSGHYARLYESLDPIGMAVQEHTAQWNATAASNIQDQFVGGKVNVLSCSTTFELGVDVGEVETVLLRNVPPRPANYVQRAGRAGRRTDSAALVVTFAQRRNHDLSHFGDPRRMVDGTISPPSILLENTSIVRRHVHSLAFAAFERRAVDSGQAPHTNVAEFFRPAENSASAPVDDFISWLESHPASVQDALDRVVPTTVVEKLGVADWAWVDALARPSEDDPTHGWLARATDQIRDELDTLDQLIDDAYNERRGRQASRFEDVKTTVSSRFLPGFLASRNVLPKYGFPVDVVELNLSGSGDADASKLELTRDLSLAISDYAPGSQVVAAKRLWKSTGVVIRANQALPTYHWATCQDCGAFRQHLEKVSDECQVCGSDRKAIGRTGSYVTPIFGFVGGSAAKTGESRPPRMSATETYFGSYRDEDPPLEPLEGFDRVHFRSSRQGLISVVNRGPRGRGFRICTWCGYGEPAPARASKRGPAEHDDIRRPGRRCNGQLAHRHFGHEYLTDVTEIRFDVPMDEPAAVSTLYALLEATPALRISREDVDGTQHRYAPSAPMAFVLFDTVPGGAGHAQRIADGIPQLIEAALTKVQGCECGPETACYNCLRSYSNQTFHDRLSRGTAEKVLLTVLGRDASGTPLLTGDFALLDADVKPLVRQAVEMGAPPPEVGFPVGPVGSGWEVEAAWPDARVAIVTDAVLGRDAWLAAEGWDSRLTGAWTATALSERAAGVRS